MTSAARTHREPDRERDQSRQVHEPEPQVRGLRGRRRPDPVLPDARPDAHRERERLRLELRAEPVPGRARRGRPAHRQPVPRHAADAGQRWTALRPESRRRPSRRASRRHHEGGHGLRGRGRNAAHCERLRLRLRLRQRRQPAGRRPARGSRRQRLDAARSALADGELVEEQPAHRFPDLAGRHHRLERPLRQHARADGERHRSALDLRIRAERDADLQRRDLLHDGLPCRLPDLRRRGRRRRPRLGAVLRAAGNAVRRQHRLRPRQHGRRPLLRGAHVRLRRRTSPRERRSARRSPRRRTTTSSRARPTAPTTTRPCRRPSSTACRCTASAVLRRRSRTCASTR